MSIIEIKSNKESKSRYKTMLAGLDFDKNGKVYLGFAVTADKRNPNAHFEAGNISVKGMSRKKVTEQIMQIVATFPPEHDLFFLDLTELDGSEKHG